jgi:hypothetical protein
MAQPHDANVKQKPMETRRSFTAFAGMRLIASGDVETLLLRTKEHLDGGERDQVLIFEDQTGKQVDFDLRGAADAILARLPSHPLFASDATPAGPRTGPGRPKLGVVSREVSLLPRHWEWLEAQSGGISVTLRKLVEEARKREPERERARLARDTAYRFMSAIAGNLAGFEEAARALFADDRRRLVTIIKPWPKDIRAYLLRLLERPAGSERD